MPSAYCHGDHLTGVCCQLKCTLFLAPLASAPGVEVANASILLTLSVQRADFLPWQTDRQPPPPPRPHPQPTTTRHHHCFHAYLLHSPFKTGDTTVGKVIRGDLAVCATSATDSTLNINGGSWPNESITANWWRCERVCSCTCIPGLKLLVV